MVFIVIVVLVLKYRRMRRSIWRRRYSCCSTITNTLIILFSGSNTPIKIPFNTFTVEFEKSGTYVYLCELHPWMLGMVMVM
jgi:hypothetical protein